MTRETHLPRLALFLFLLALVTLAPPSLAADEETEAARAHYDVGVAAMEGGDCAAAVEAFEKAMAIKPHFQIAGNLGACELELKKYREAAEHLHWALKQLEFESGREQEKEALGQMLERSRLQVGSLRITVTGHSAEQAKVKLDGDELAEIPELLFVTAGKHQVEARAPGAEKVAVEVTATAGETMTVALPLKAGTGPGGEEIVPTDGEEEGEGITTVPFWSALAATVIFSGVGVGVLVAGGGAQSDADARRDEIRASGQGCPDDCPELVDMYDEADTLYNASAGLFIFGGVSLIATVAYGVILLTDDNVVDESSVADDAHLTPSFAVTPNGDTFIGLSGQF